MKINPRYLLVEIDHEKQKSKKEKIGSIYLDQRFTHMKYNLQYGTLVAIGEFAARNFPEAEIGDTIIFHHFVESEDEKWRLIDTLPNKNELRLVDGYNNKREVFAILKKDYSQLIPNPMWLFLSPNMKKADPTPITSLALVDTEAFEDEGYLERKINDLTAEIDSLQIAFESADNPDKLDEIYKEMCKKQEEKGQITTYMNAKKMCYATVLFAHPTTTEETGIHANNSILISKDIVYGLIIESQQFCLIPTTEVDAVVN